MTDLDTRTAGTRRVEAGGASTVETSLPGPRHRPGAREPALTAVHTVDHHDGTQHPLSHGSGQPRIEEPGLHEPFHR